MTEINWDLYKLNTNEDPSLLFEMTELLGIIDAYQQELGPLGVYTKLSTKRTQKSSL